MLDTRKNKNFLKTKKAISTSIEEDWALAYEIFPDLRKIYLRIEKISAVEAENFRQSLIASKEWSTRFSEAKTLELKIIHAACGENIQIKNYLISLLDNENWEATKYFLKLVNFTGENIELNILRSLVIKKHPVLHSKKSGLTEHSDQLTKFINDIKHYSNNQKKYSGFEKLKGSTFGKFYIDKIKPNPIGRLIAIELWKKYYPTYIKITTNKIFKNHSVPWLNLIKLETYAEHKNITKNIISAPKLVITPPPKVNPPRDQKDLISPHDNYLYPQIYFLKLKNITATGGSNLLISDNFIIHHDLYRFTHDYTSEELHGRLQLSKNKLKAKFLEKDTNPINIERGAFFVDACATNYAHWLTEVLPRISLFCNNKDYEDIPLIINDNLHKNILESLFLAVGKLREIVTVPLGRDIFVNEFYAMSVAGYVPFERRNKLLTNHSHGLFSPDGINSFKEKIIEKLKNNLTIESPEKIYIKRNSHARNLTNSDEIENLLISNGFSIVEPEKLNFAEQVNVFRNARIIFSASGAALANIIFCKNNIDIFIFLSKNPDTSYWYWQNIACSTGNKINYILGESSLNNQTSIHADFSISTGEIQHILSAYEQ